MDKPLTRNISADRQPTDISAYEANGGYSGSEKNEGRAHRKLIRLDHVAGFRRAQTTALHMLFTPVHPLEDDAVKY